MGFEPTTRFLYWICSPTVSTIHAPYMAPGVGFEPTRTELETVMLPLHHPGV